MDEPTESKISTRKSKRKNKPGAGRPHKPIDWDLVNESLVKGALGCEVAAEFDMHPCTFYEKVFNEFGENFTNYASKLRKKGERSLRTKQYDEAMKGNTTLLVWLGKQKLSQRDQPVDEDIINSFATLKKAFNDGKLAKLLSQEEE